MLTYLNYHRHSYYTNTGISDSTSSNEDYAKRANDLGHGIIATWLAPVRGLKHNFAGFARKITLQQLGAICKLP